MLRLTALITISILLLVSLTGCYYGVPEDIKAFARPDEVLLSSKEYRLMPPDEIEIHCSRVPEIDLKRQQIRPDGILTFEKLGPIEAANKTAGELSELIKEKVLKVYALPGENPISVQIRVYRSKFYYVLGEVRYPGPQLIDGRNTTFRAISEATPLGTAWDKRVQVIRPSSDPDKKPSVYELNFKDMMVKGDFTKDVLLEEGDIVYVPPTILAQVGKMIGELTSPINSSFSTINTVQRASVGPTGAEGGGGLF